MRAGALFAGMGGFCQGFASVGIPTVWAVDNDPLARLTYERNIDGVEFISDDIRAVSVRKSKLEPVDILHAGFPCQSFSQAGRRSGFDDPRGKLFFEIIRIIGEFKDKRPKVLVFENSPYLRYGEGGAWFLEIQRQIQRAGYWFREANCAELNAYDITVLPQQRTRLYMVAFSTKHFRSGQFRFPVSKHHKAKRLEKYVDFSGQQHDDYYLDKENRYYKMIMQRMRDPRCLYQLRKYVVRPQEPGTCPTLTANMGLGGHNVPFVRDQKGLRKLTENECLLLQGFPRNFRFPDDVPRWSRYTQIGNAVTVPVVSLLAKQIIERMGGYNE